MASIWYKKQVTAYSAIEVAAWRKYQEAIEHITDEEIIRLILEYPEVD